MQFFKIFLRNLLLLFVMGVVLFIFFPDVMNQVFQLYGALFGPLILLIIIVVALPRRSRSSR